MPNWVKLVLCLLRKLRLLKNRKLNKIMASARNPAVVSSRAFDQINGLEVLILWTLVIQSLEWYFTIEIFFENESQNENLRRHWNIIYADRCCLFLDKFRYEARGWQENRSRLSEKDLEEGCRADEKVRLVPAELCADQKLQDALQVLGMVLSWNRLARRADGLHIHV